EGRFRLSVRERTPCIRAAHPRYRVGEACNLKPSLGREISGIEIVLGAGARLSGIVVDNHHTPVVGATVRLTHRKWQHSRMFDKSYRFRAETEAHGVFEFNGVDQLPVVVTAETATASADLLDVDLTKTASVEGLVIVLKFEGTITGEVVEQGGGPLAFAPVEY